jgi:uncharacterized OB-fold protein
MNIESEWRRIPLSPCRECTKFTTAPREICQRCEKEKAGA